ncbi:GntR family transcriptional regulator [Zavarzinia sp.]|uniref:GntR family transcriptional regulator n=1 Tax=Zavarzinia sp. TaxID=2027920 RepID=UPI00356AD6D9
MPAQVSRVDLAYRAMRQAIIEQQLAPGTKLPEDEIGEAFAISRTLVRQALARLKADGLVDTGGKRTATVARPSLAEAREIFRVRRALEREAVHLVAEAWKPEFGARLEGHVRAEDAARAAGDERVSIRLAGEFHLLLAELTGNRTLIDYVTQLVVRCSLILALYGRPHSSDCAVNEHRDIIAALRDGDAGRAVDLMDHHVALVESRALLAEAADAPKLSALLGRYASAAEAEAEGAKAGPRAVKKGGKR